ncbi:MAG: hypothetical protein JXB03_10000, partial [Spirochaetales bacterium]|nr:hypothetical protein [Spirochaetales bacterium]
EEEEEEEEEEEQTAGITGTAVTAVSNCVYRIEGSRFTASGSYSTPTYITKRIPVSLASSSDDNVTPAGQAILFARLIMNDSYSFYYLLEGQNTSNDDFKYVYARGLSLQNASGTQVKRVDSTMRGHLREYDTSNQTSSNIGLRPDDTGYFFTYSPTSMTLADFNSITQAELTLSLGLNEPTPGTGTPALTPVSAELTVLGYRFGEKDGDLGLEISIQNTGTTPAKLNSIKVVLMDGDSISLYHGSFVRFPTGGLLQPGETGGFFRVGTDLGNASADEVFIILDYQDPAQ